MIDRALPEWLGDVLAACVGVFIAGAIMGLCYESWVYLPCLDGWMMPVVHFGPVTDIYREAHDATYTTGRACFTLHVTKLREGVPLPYRFRVSTTYSPSIGVAVHLANPDNSRAASQAYETHPVGSTWDRRYCFELTGTIADADAVTVTGSGFHRRHPGWLTEEPTPTFTIGPAKPVSQ